MTPNALRIDRRDNVVTLLQSVARGARVAWEGGELVSRQEIPVAHKMAIEPIPVGAEIRKYGQAIGAAGSAIAAGDLVHTHNLAAVQRSAEA